MSNNIILKARDIDKIYPGTHALKKVNFNIYYKQVNVLVGENGAGKSTLMKILAGVESPSGGMLELENNIVQFRSVEDANRAGIGIVFQELNLFPNLNVIDNIFITREMYKNGIIDNKSQKEITRKLLGSLDCKIDPLTLVGNLKIGEQQIVEIAKSLVLDVKILIMDEPTSALSSKETDKLFKVIRGLIDKGVSIVYISHRLEELINIGDRITVLRDGCFIKEELISNINVPWIIEQMTGEGTFFSQSDDYTGKNNILNVKNITLMDGSIIKLDNIEFTLKDGEILGLYGLMGAGRTELLECIMGVNTSYLGDIFLDGININKLNISNRILKGINLIPEDRQRDGIIQSMCIGHNMTLSSLHDVIYKNIHINSKLERDKIFDIKKRLSIRYNNNNNLIVSLSGGNQQKIVIGKCLLTSPRVLLMDEPTRGIDIGAKRDVFNAIRYLSSNGMAILIASSELEEIISIPSRVLVLSSGKIIQEFFKNDITKENLLTAANLVKI